MKVQKDTVYKVEGQKKVKDEYKDPEVLPKVNKVDMIGAMEAINEGLRSCHSIERMLLAYIIRMNYSPDQLHLSMVCSS